MAHLNLNYDELTAIISIGISLMGIDGYRDKREAMDLIKSVTDQYNFEDKVDLLESYLEDAEKMDSAVAIYLLKKVGIAEKQFASNLFANIIIADGELDPSEKEAYLQLVDVCELPMYQQSAIHD